MTAASDAARTRRWWGFLTGVLLLVSCGDDPVAVDPVCAAARPLLPGDTVEGVLTRGGAMFAGGYVDYYGLSLGDSATVEVGLESAAFDPLLFVFRGGQVREQAFDTIGAPSGEAEMAVIRRRLPPGCHLLGASSWEDRATGAYTLRADTIRADIPAGAGSD